VEDVAGHYGEFTVLVEGEEVITAGKLAMLGILPSLRQVREAVERKGLS